MTIPKKQTKPKIAIFGLYKTGTTALFSNVKNSLDYSPRYLFESKAYISSEKDEDQGVLAKVILGAHDTNYASFLQFDKKILIIRDPRDWLISGCIFLIQQIPEIYQNRDVLDRIRHYLHLKEKMPRLYPFCDLLEFVLGFSGLKNVESFKRWVKTLHRDFIDFSTADKSIFKIFYEDFVDRKTGRLSEYLNIGISDDLTLEKAHAHVPRTKGYGNWRDWYTQKDIDLLRPLFEDYLNHFGYDPQFNLHVKPMIRPEDCSEYVEKIIALRLAGIQSSTKE